MAAEWMADINIQSGKEPGPLERDHIRTWEVESSRVEVQFRLVLRKLNIVADRLAKEATALADEEHWKEIKGVLC
jgi:hypothetical protein